MKTGGLYFLIMVVLTSCFTKRSIPKEGDLRLDKIEYDSTIHQIPNLDSAENFLLMNNRIVIEEGYNPTVDKGRRIKNNKPNVDIIDLTTPSDSTMGIMSYNVPEKLRVNQWSTIKLRISRSDDSQSILFGRIPIIDTNRSNDMVVIESILVSEQMSAKLWGDIDVFDIESPNLGRQDILERGYTEWTWRIRPKKSGRYYLKMIITQGERDMIVYEKIIEVISNPTWSFSVWFSKWWQPIFTIIIIPLIIPILNRFKKN
jgi:hypothetical protein